MKDRTLGIAEAELTERVADSMKVASRSYVEAVLRALVAAGFDGLTPATASLLSAVPEEGVQAAALAERTDRSKQAVSKLIEELEAGGYVKRAPVPKDRRGQLVILTKRGRAVVDAGARIKGGLAERAAEILGADEMIRLQRDLDALAALFADDPDRR